MRAGERRPRAGRAATMCQVVPSVSASLDQSGARRPLDELARVTALRRLGRLDHFMVQPRKALHNRILAVHSGPPESAESRLN